MGLRHVFDQCTCVQIHGCGVLACVYVWIKIDCVQQVCIACGMMDGCKESCHCTGMMVQATHSHGMIFFLGKKRKCAAVFLFEPKMSEREGLLMRKV